MRVGHASVRYMTVDFLEGSPPNCLLQWKRDGNKDEENGEVKLSSGKKLSDHNSVEQPSSLPSTGKSIHRREYPITHTYLGVLRNFKARNDGNRLTMNFLASPTTVTAMAFSGQLSFNPITGKLPPMAVHACRCQAGSQIRSHSRPADPSSSRLRLAKIFQLLVSLRVRYRTTRSRRPSRSRRQRSSSPRTRSGSRFLSRSRAPLEKTMETRGVSSCQLARF